MASPLLGFGRARVRLTRSLHHVRSPCATLRPGPGSATSSRRAASTWSTSSSSGAGISRSIRILGIGNLVLAASALTFLLATDTRSSLLHTHVVPRVLRAAFSDAEDAHHFGIAALGALYAVGMHPRERASRAVGQVSSSVFGTTLDNPIGISAGLDKNAEIPDVLFGIGAGIVEVGGCTPEPQEGNPRPRVFRVPRLDGMVNRYGLNSIGADAMAAKLRDRVRRYARAAGVEGGERAVLDGRAGVPAGSLIPGRLLCVQIAKQKETSEANVDAVAQDYVYCVKRLAPYADVVVVNVSSPNTPGLRDLQASGPLTKILSAVVDEASRTERKQKPKVMVKVSPDEDSPAQVEDIVRAVISSGVDGVIIGNTTKRRDGLVPQGVRLPARQRQALAEDGGYSGPALFDRTVNLVKQYRRILDRDVLRAGAKMEDRKVIFATGGITNGTQAAQVLDAGASVAMVYTALIYGGVGTISRIKYEFSRQAR